MVTLPHCHTVTLSHCHTVTMSHSHNVTPSHLCLFQTVPADQCWSGSPQPANQRMVRQKSGEMASPTPSIDSLNGVLAMCDTTDHPIDTYSHVFSGLGSSSGVSSATSSSSSASSLDRASTGSASSTSGQCPRPDGAERHHFTFYICCVTTRPACIDFIKEEAAEIYSWL